jgi:hypothetical protein
MNEVSIIINGVKYDSELRGLCPNKCEKCDLFHYCFNVGVGMKNICELFTKENISFKRESRT